MRFQVSFISDKEILLPIHYNSAVQGMIYNNISEELSKHLHDSGYLYGQRAFKLFTFSRIVGKFKMLQENEQIIFYPPVSLTVSSPIDTFIYELGQKILLLDHVILGNNILKVDKFEYPPEPTFTSSMLIGMMSPLTVYSTLKTFDGRTKTHYYSPYEKEFSQIVEADLRKKYSLIHNMEPSDTMRVSITPVKVSKECEKIIRYRDTVIKAWRGIYLLEGSPELIKVGYGAGLGCKNSQGFGCFKFLERGESDYLG